MTQYLKEDVRERIAGAAVAVFAQRGYAEATIAQIAAAAGLSSGNIYRYYRSKSTLFHEVVSDSFVRQFTALLHRRVQSLEGVHDARALEANHLYHLASEELLRFCIDNRLRVVILLGHCEGSRHAGFAERTVQDLIALAIAHFRMLQPEIEVTTALHFNLNQIYHSFVRTMTTVLGMFDDEVAIREIVAGYTRYHLAGLKYLIEGASDAAPAAAAGQRSAKKKAR